MIEPRVAISLERWIGGLLVLATVGWISNGCAPPAPGDTEGIRDINGTPLFVKTIGSGEPIVVVHGGPAWDHAYFLPGLAALGETHQLIFYDQRGSGQTQGPLTPENITLANFVEDIDGLREAFGIDRMILYGHSFGAYLAAAYAAKYPERLESLILSNPTEPGHRFDSLANVRAAAARIPQDSIDLAAIRRSEGIANRDPATLSEMFQVSLRPTFHDRALSDQLKVEFTPAGANAVFEVAALLFPSGRRDDLWSQLTNVLAPTLVVGGASDIVPPQLLAELSDALPNGSVVVIAEAGHFPFIERPDEYLAAIRGFLNAN